jgi:hypothetical protein
MRDPRAKEFSSSRLEGETAENNGTIRAVLMGSCIFSFAVSSNLSVLISRMELWRLKPKIAI